MARGRAAAMRLVVTALVVVLLAVLGDAGAFMSHRWLVPNLYFPMIRALDRKATTARKVFGGLSRMFSEYRSESVWSPTWRGDTSNHETPVGSHC